MSNSVKAYSNNYYIHIPLPHGILLSNNVSWRFKDYKKVIPTAHPFDYLRDLVKSHNGSLLEESEDFTIGISDKHHKQKSIDDVLSAVDNHEQY